MKLPPEITAQGMESIPYLTDDLGLLEHRIAEMVVAHDIRGHHVTLLDAKLVQFSPDWESYAHRHAHYEADIILSGQGYITTDPVQRIEAGTLIYHPPEFPHVWHTSDLQGCSVLSLKAELLWQTDFSILEIAE